MSFLINDNDKIKFFSISSASKIKNFENLYEVYSTVSIILRINDFTDDIITNIVIMMYYRTKPVFLNKFNINSTQLSGNEFLFYKCSFSSIFYLTDFSRNEFKNCKFVRAHIKYAHLSNTKFTNCMFYDCVMEECELEGAVFNRCIFSICIFDLQNHAKFIDCKFYDIQVTDQEFDYNKFLKCSFFNVKVLFILDYYL